MGPRQVLRVAVTLGALALGAGAAAARPARHAHAGRPAPAHDEPVVLVDLRAPDASGAGGGRDASRAALADALDRGGGLKVQRSGLLDGALAGDGSGDAADAAAALADARAAYGRLDCAAARPAAEKAALAYAGRQAAGERDGDAPRAAWAYVLSCADRDGDHGGAAVAARMLRALGVVDGSEAGIGADTWMKYPDVDARTENLVELSVASDGGDVWIDLARVGAAPATAVVAAGEHVVAAASGPRRAARRVTATGKAAAVTLALEDQGGAWADVAAQVAAWRTAAPTGVKVAALLRELHARFALIIQPGAALAGSGPGVAATTGDTVDVWVLGPGDEVARQVDRAGLDAAALGAMVADRVAAWDANAPDPDRPLLVEDRGGAGSGEVKASDHWWVYAALIGAIVAGGAAVYAHDSATDHQRVEVRFP